MFKGAHLLGFLDSHKNESVSNFTDKAAIKSVHKPFLDVEHVKMDTIQKVVLLV